MQLRVAAVNLQAEHVFPLTAADLQPGGVAGGIAQADKGVVVDRHVPEIGGGMPFHRGEVAQKDPGQIDQMHTLIDQLSTP